MLGCGRVGYDLGEAAAVHQPADAAFESAADPTGSGGRPGASDGGRGLSDAEADSPPVGSDSSAAICDQPGEACCVDSAGRDFCGDWRLDCVSGVCETGTTSGDAIVATQCDEVGEACCPRSRRRESICADTRLVCVNGTCERRTWSGGWSGRR